MRPRFVAASLSLLLFNMLFGQSIMANELNFPFLGKEDQSNVVVSVSDLFGAGEPCPIEYTNTLANTNLFTSEQRKEIGAVLLKYQHVTTNSGPAGTVLTGLYKTNNVMKLMGKAITNKTWIATFHYTNIDAREKISFLPGMVSEFRDKSNSGYGVSFNRTGGGTLLSFWEVKDGLPDGLLVRFVDKHPQEVSGDYKLASVTNGCLVEYSQYTNGLVFGKYLMWNPRNNNLLLEANFKRPFDLEKHRTDLRFSR